MLKSKIHLFSVILSAFLALACAFETRFGQAKTEENQQLTNEKNAAAENGRGAADALTQDAATLQNAGVRFKGSIGASRFEMTLRRDGNLLDGSYYYVKSGSANQLKLAGKVDENGKFTLQERDAAGKQTGEFSGIWKTDPNEAGVALEGEWKKTGAKESISFYAEEQMIFFASPAAQINTKTVRETNRVKRFEINAEYPEISGVPNAAKFNVAAQKLGTRSVAGFRKDMLSQAAEDLKYLPAGMNNSLDTSYRIEHADDDLVSVSFINSIFTGGAHPNHYFSTLTYDLKNGREIKLAELFKPGAKYLDKIAEYAIADLRGRNDESGESLGLATDIWAEGAAPKAENYDAWNITKKGLMFTFDPYQVGPYAAGPQTVIVPYAKLKDLARTGGALSQTAK